MSAVAEIEAAIEKLTELRASVSGGHFKAMAYYATGGTGGYAELSLVLHRTIDAQLAILDYAARGIRLYDRVPYANEVNLARAIIGTE